MSILHLDISLALRGHIGGPGGKAPGGVERHNVIIVIVEFGGAAYQPPPNHTYDSQNAKKGTFTISISLRSKKSNTTNN
jgi:hypothetical protein